MLKSGANVLLLDEPTNDIDVNTMRALEDALDNFAGCVLVVSHDRWFLDRVATHIMAFEDDAQVDFFEGNFSEYEEDRKKRLGKDADTPHRPKFRKLTRRLGPGQFRSVLPGGKETPLASAQGAFPSPRPPPSFPQRAFSRGGRAGIFRAFQL